jgi:hypothetical protein
MEPAAPGMLSALTCHFQQLGLRFSPLNKLTNKRMICNLVTIHEQDNVSQRNISELIIRAHAVKECDLNVFGGHPIHEIVKSLSMKKSAPAVPILLKSRKSSSNEISAIHSAFKLPACWQ